jgi:translation initiation factor 2-alpha kinase 4
MLERSAIKKVKLPSNPALEQKILREVTIWGRLSHPGIVRYHTSWVETDTRSTDVKQALGMLTGSSEGSVVGTDSMEQSLSDVEESAEDDSSTTDGSGSEAGTISYENDEEIDLGFDDLDFMSTVFRCQPYISETKTTLATSPQGQSRETEPQKLPSGLRRN